MPDSPQTDYRELLELLSREVAEWEHSRYYLPEEEIFDLERFLCDHRAPELKDELEREFGAPLNRTFWASSLRYWRLRQAREEVKRQDAEQDQKRHEYLRAQGERKNIWQDWLKGLTAGRRRGRFRVIPGGKKES
jgi:hypothetical protein